MTTRVIIFTGDHAAAVFGFPQIDREPVAGGLYDELGIVPPHSSGEFAAHSGQDILVKELAEADAVATVPVEGNGDYLESESEAA